MVNYREADLHDFLNMIVEDQFIKDKKLPKQPCTRFIVKQKESQKRSFKLTVTYKSLDEILYETEFFVSAKSFKNKEYNFSYRWQRYLFNNENTQMI